MRRFTTCRTPCLENLIQGRNQCVLCVSFEFFETTGMYAVCAYGNGLMLVVDFLIHFDSSIHAALKLPEILCCGQAPGYCRHWSGKKMCFLWLHSVLHSPRWDSSCHALELKGISNLSLPRGEAPSGHAEREACSSFHVLLVAILLYFKGRTLFRTPNSLG